MYFTSDPHLFPPSISMYFLLCFMEMTSISNIQFLGDKMVMLDATNPTFFQFKLNDAFASAKNKHKINAYCSNSIAFSHVAYTETI